MNINININRDLRKIIRMLVDSFAIQISFFLAFLVRFDKNLFTSPEMIEYRNSYFDIFLIVILIKITIFYVFEMYSSLWRYLSVEDMVKIIIGCIVASLAFVSYCVIFNINFPRSIYILTLTFDLIFVGSIRIGYRVLKHYLQEKKHTRDLKNILIIGAGKTGSTIIKELKNNKNAKGIPVAAIDDDESKTGISINGVPILGTRRKIKEVIKTKKINQIIIAIPTADKQVIKDIVKEIGDSNCEIKIVPSLHEIIENNININAIRKIDIKDLLSRNEVKLNPAVMENYVKNKVILVTGAGGSIGSELCRKISKFSPKKLVMLDNYENDVFMLEQELLRKYENLNSQVVIASIRDKDRIFKIFDEEKPYVVFHAAAHKHVSLMEANPAEAIKNNVFGSYNLMVAAKESKVSRFVLISTDKAVNPTNIMGATKRLVEIILSLQKNNSETKFVAVRFGNVLGSNGSVVKIFKKQIESGGPVTVTHPNVTRYFMTISEAAKLVIQASSFAKNGEIYILDMGEPVKITDLAENVIRVSGFMPHKDIEIKYTGLRPGEKMFEELLLNEKNSIKTEANKIFVEKSDDTPYPYTTEEILDDLSSVLQKDFTTIKKVLQKYVETYKDEN